MPRRLCCKQERQVEDTKGAGQDDVQQQLQARQCHLRMLSLLCYSNGPLDPAAMLQLMVMVQHAACFVDDPALRVQQAPLLARCKGVMACRSAEVIVTACTTQSILTDAAAAVLADLKGMPLQWQQLSGPASTKHGSFESVTQDGRLVSLNVLDGCLLLDGNPPSRLPPPVLSHPLYLQTFGHVNFEVSTTSDSVFMTTRPVYSCFYHFCLRGQQLTVTEVNRQAPHPAQSRLQLLDTGTDGACKPWGAELPVRMRLMHSHWLCRTSGVILLRPRAFYERATHFLLCLSGTEDGYQPYSCWRVPLHLQALQWTQLLTRRHELTDQAILPRTSHVCCVLSKMEAVQFIHVYLRAKEGQGCGCAPHSDGSPSGVAQGIIYELPRLGLEFLLQGGKLQSLDYAGYVLGQQQQLVLPSYTLPGFQQYLLLQLEGQLGMSSKMLVPFGRVCSDRRPAAVEAHEHAGRVWVETSKTINERIQVNTFEIHSRFMDVRAPSIQARLQLAALYAATSTLLPEPGSRKTGAQMAMQLVRQCWKDTPLSAAEQAQLSSIAQLGGNYAGGLQLLVHELQLSTQQLSHLHGGCGVSLQPPHTDAGLLYQQDVEPPGGGWCGFAPNLRMVLTCTEQQRAWGLLRPPAVPVAHWVTEMRQAGSGQMHVPACPVPVEAVHNAENWLASLVRFKAPPVAPPPYPLHAGRPGGSQGPLPLEADMHAELAESWHMHHAQQGAEGIDMEHLQLQAEVACMHMTTKEQRIQVEAYLLDNLTSVASETRRHGACFRFMRVCGAAPTAGLTDLAHAALVPPSGLLSFNPFLSTASCVCLRDAALVWMQLCVLEDRLCRISKAAGAGQVDMPGLLQELLTKRTWSVEEHPQWLVFEVEGMLQIRPIQVKVAEHLLSNPGAVIQLNMGEGKTRVILPMLALHCANGESVVRIHLLSQLMDEAYGFLHSFLTASIINKKLMRHPFHRDVEITAQGAVAMRSSLAHCQEVGGLLLVAPEHRASLLLKRDEAWLWGDCAVSAQLDMLAAMAYVDLVDENDVVLSHKYQLVYAAGEPCALPSREERVAAIQALLQAVSKLIDTPGSILHTPGVAVWTDAASRAPGAYSGVRLLESEALERVEHVLCIRLADMVFDDPPYELRWLRNSPLKASLKRCVLDISVSAQELVGLEVWECLTDGQQADLLALRGMLAAKFLLHALQKRHKVDYGVSRLQSARKRLAVPFRAADWPAERSEWAQPDVAILLTQISYYNDGLSLPEMVQAVQVLLSQGTNAQISQYKEWLDSSSMHMPPDHLCCLDEASKLDASNAQQMELMHIYFGKNMRAVDFWLRYCILSQETKQYPQRLSVTAWHLADNAQGSIIGFSGTNDAHRLLPFQVHQSDPREVTLSSTNGKMLNLILNNPKYSTIPDVCDTDAAQRPLWQSLLDMAAHQSMDAVIDCGALLAGVDSSKAAEYIMPRLSPQRFKGVCFFSPVEKEWIVLEARGRRMPKQCSPVAERECFAIFDDARCRGADLKLRQNATGLLTLGPGATKDKLMQAAGRLRMLGRGQALCLAGSKEVTDKVLQSMHGLLQAPQGSTATSSHTKGKGGSSSGSSGSSGSSSNSSSGSITSHQVLQWVMDNTVQMMIQGVLEHARKGLNFAESKAASAQGQPLLQREKYELDGMYGEARLAREVGEEVHLLAQQLHGAWQQQQQQQQHSASMSPLSAAPEGEAVVGVVKQHQQEQLQQLVQTICDRSARHGHGHMIMSGKHGCDEECERELQKEEEEEEQQERQVPRVKPRQEEDWQQLEAAVSATSASALSSCTQVLRLPEVIACHTQPSSLATIPWCSDVLATQNFVRAVALPTHGKANLCEYLRPLDALLLFADGSVLLLSEREADILQGLVWRQPQPLQHHHISSSSRPPVLVQLCYARMAYQMGKAPLLAQSLNRAHLRTGIEPLTLYCLTNLQLFNGATMYTHSSISSSIAKRIASMSFKELQALVSRKRKAAEELVTLRGKLRMLPRSDLELASEGDGP